MRTFVAIFLTAVLGMGLMPLSSWAEESQGGSPQAEPKHGETFEGSFAQGELLVEFDDAFSNGKRTSSYGISQMLDENDAVVIEEVASATQETGTIVVVEIGDQDVSEAIERIEALPGVSKVQRNFAYRLPEGESAIDDSEEDSASDEAGNAALSGGEALATTVNDPMAPEQYYLKSWAEGHGADLFEAWDLARCDSGVAIAVLDTGIRVDHEDLNANILTDCMRDIVNNTEPGTITSAGVPNGDNVGHGTHVAGIAAGVANNSKGIAGASYNAKILPIKVFSDESYEPACYTRDLVKAYAYLFDLIASGKVEGLHVVNMSLGGYGALDEQDALLEQAIETARDSYQILTVAAGGNGNSRDTAYTTPSYPSDFDACMAVTALDSSGANVVWSDYNQYKDISASGSNILSTYKSSNNSYAKLSGTSMASPLVAGSAALLWAAYPTLTVDQVKTSIYQTANPIDPASANYRGSETGSHGAIDAAAAIAYARDNFAGGGSRQLSRLGGDDRYATMALVSKAAFPADGSCPTVIVARGDNFPDALAAAGLAGVCGGQVLLTETGALTAETRAEITRLGAKRAYVIGDEHSVTARTFNEVKSLVGGSATRLGGEDRLDTALKIYQAGGSGWGTTAIVATGKKAADSLSASTVAYALKAPIFLADDSGSLPASALDAIAKGGFDNVVVLGDQYSVSKATFDKVKASVGSAERIGGADRYITSQLTAQWALKHGFTCRAASLTAGREGKYADALVASSLGGRSKSVLLLVDDGSGADVCVSKVLAPNKGQVNTAYVLGDKYTVSDKLYAAIQKALA